MSTWTRLLAFLGACVALFALALGVGRLVGPVSAEPVTDDHGMGEEAMDMSGGHHDLGGVASTAGGYTLTLGADRLPAGRQRLTFTIVDHDGTPVTAYDEQHERDLHLIVVRRDLTGYQHLHPTLDTASGEWSIDADLVPGAWRVLADTLPTGGEPVVLGADLLVPGDFDPAPLGPDRLAAEVDGYDVALDGALVAGGETVLTATVSRDGAPVTDLEPYLGAYGHLVSLRDGDLGYLHVHPDEDGGPGPRIGFHTEFPSAGRYRLFLDFQHAGTVHTAVFTVSVGATEADDHDD
jgi:hypothetical protein